MQDIPLIIFLLKRLHVLSDVTSEDVLFEDLSIQLLGLWVVSGETLLVVGNVNTTVTSTLEGTEHTGTSRSTLETNVKVTLERPGSIFLIESLGQRKLAIGFSNTLILVSKTQFGQGTTSDEETSGVSCRNMRI